MLLEEMRGGAASGEGYDAPRTASVSPALLQACRPARTRAAKPARYRDVPPNGGHPAASVEWDTWGRRGASRPSVGGLGLLEPPVTPPLERCRGRCDARAFPLRSPQGRYVQLAAQCGWRLANPVPDRGTTVSSGRGCGQGSEPPPYGFPSVTVGKRVSEPHDR
jgi:hypothetical protein